MPSQWITETTLNIGHRGASAAAPANTLPAFHLAAEMGADGVELDVHCSADGVPVVIHDWTVDATTDGRGRVADFSLGELQELDAGSWFDPRFAGARIPTLEEVLEAVGRVLLLNVELKVQGSDDTGLEARVADLIEQFEMAERVLVSSFNPHALRRFRRLASRVPIGFLYGPLPASWLARWQVRRWPELRPEAINPFWPLIRRATVRRAHARGQRVVAWTVDDPDVMRRLVAWGVDAIITNHPDRLREVLEAR